MSSAALNIFGVIASALGIIGTIPLLCMFIMRQLPIAKSKALEDALSETGDLLIFVVEEGLMTEDTFNGLGREFDDHQERHIELKFDAYRDDCYASQLKGMVSGLSYRIYATYRKVRKMHSKISVGCCIVPLLLCRLMYAILQSTAYDNKAKCRVGVRSILPALRRASAGVVYDTEEKLDNAADSSPEDQRASKDESGTPYDTRGPPAYYANVCEKTFTRYTEALRTNDGEAVPDSTASAATQ
ncbi:hypothetical protein C8Q72DRAFT_247512 [Fomitopsis betulina]|nr:hypothetical protein C8Q72DRAFT_247512 [Fomitopsis betulina]